MARKRLSDLLREEVQKPTEADTAPPEAVDAPTIEIEAEVAAEPATDKTTKSEPAKATKKTPAKTAKPDGANPAAESITALQTEIDTLTTALTTSENRVGELQKEIAALQAELQAKTTETQTLTSQLDKATQQARSLEQELAEAKQTILQLAETNTQLQAKQQTAIAPPAARPTTPAKPAPSTGKLTNSPLSQQEIIHRRQAESLAHPIFPSTDKTPGQLSEQDLGWVD